jgi:hypothetical protein
VTFTAVVQAVAAESGPPAGTVTFTDGTTTLASIHLTSGTATLTTKTLAVGNHPIKATYNGAAALLPSSTPTLNQSVHRASTTLTLTSSADPSVAGQSVTFAAVVKVAAPGSGTATGTVTFTDGATTLATVNLAAATAKLTIRTLAVGNHSIKATYSGSVPLLRSGAPTLTQTVHQASTAVTLTSSANPSAAGQSVTFAAVVKAVAPGSGTPSGSVTFTDGTTTLATVNVSSFTARLTIKTLAVGNHQIGAIYNGSSSLLGSAANLTQTVH